MRLLINLPSAASSGARRAHRTQETALERRAVGLHDHFIGLDRSGLARSGLETLQGVCALGFSERRDHPGHALALFGRGIERWFERHERGVRLLEPLEQVRELESGVCEPVQVNGQQARRLAAGDQLECKLQRSTVPGVVHHLDQMPAPPPALGPQRGGVIVIAPGPGRVADHPAAVVVEAFDLLHPDPDRSRLGRVAHQIHRLLRPPAVLPVGERDRMGEPAELTDLAVGAPAVHEQLVVESGDLQAVAADPSRQQDCEGDHRHDQQWRSDERDQLSIDSGQWVGHHLDAECPSCARRAPANAKQLTLRIHPSPIPFGYLATELRPGYPNSREVLAGGLKPDTTSKSGCLSRRRRRASLARPCAARWAT